jgi:hypothetical protein
MDMTLVADDAPKRRADENAEQEFTMKIHVGFTLGTRSMVV